MSTFTIKVFVNCAGCQEKIVSGFSTSNYPGQIYCPCDTLNILEKLPQHLVADRIYHLEVTNFIQDYLRDGSG